MCPFAIEGNRFSKILTKYYFKQISTSPAQWLNPRSKFADEGFIHFTGLKISDWNDAHPRFHRLDYGTPVGTSQRSWQSKETNGPAAISRHIVARIPVKIIEKNRPLDLIYSNDLSYLDSQATRVLQGHCQGMRGFTVYISCKLFRKRGWSIFQISKTF